MKFAQLNSYAVRVFGTSSKMFVIFVMSCLGPKECHRSSVGENETRDETNFVVGISILFSGNMGDHPFTSQASLLFLLQK